MYKPPQTVVLALEDIRSQYTQITGQNNLSLKPPASV
jgi:hypothetical protein